MSGMPFPKVNYRMLSNEEQQVINARDLHQSLEIGRDFTTWIKDQLESLGFIEDFDFSPSLGNIPDGPGRPRKDYFLTLDTAKQIALASRTEKGRQIRRYFIEIEKAARQAVITGAGYKLNRRLAERLHLIQDGMAIIERLGGPSDDERVVFRSAVRSAIAPRSRMTPRKGDGRAPRDLGHRRDLLLKAITRHAGKSGWAHRRRVQRGCGFRVGFRQALEDLLKTGEVEMAQDPIPTGGRPRTLLRVVKEATR